MERSRILILTSSETIPVAENLRDVLEMDHGGATDLALTDLAHILPADCASASLVICVHRDRELLARTAQTMRQMHIHAALLFVDLLPAPTACISLLGEGFDDFIPLPLSRGEVGARVRKHSARMQVSRSKEVERIKNRLSLEVSLSDLIGSGSSFTHVLQEIVTLARTDAPVLISGETGTGKDLCARAIHYAGSRANRPFVAVNCGGIPDELFENEFFGHERGAFTDARERYAGLLREAEGGTVFLDDVESLSLRNQTKLLRFLQGTGYMPLGSAKLVNADVRVIAATNVDILQMARGSRFREDLYFRLAVLTLIIPPLRSRREDIPALAEHFLRHYCELYGKPLMSLSPASLHALRGYSWPGNVRELENVIHRAVVHGSSTIIEHLDIGCSHVGSNESSDEGFHAAPFNLAKKDFVTRFEREYVETLLRECGGNVSEAARRAGKDRRAFWEIMRKHRISRHLE